MLALTIFGTHHPTSPFGRVVKTSPTVTPPPSRGGRVRRPRIPGLTAIGGVQQSAQSIAGAWWCAVGDGRRSGGWEGMVGAGAVGLGGGGGGGVGGLGCGGSC